MDEELDSDLEQCLKDWTDLSNEYADLEELYTKYKSKLDELCFLRQSTNVISDANIHIHSSYLVQTVYVWCIFLKNGVSF